MTRIYKLFKDIKIGQYFQYGTTVYKKDIMQEGERYIYFGEQFGDRRESQRIYLPPLIEVEEC